MKFRSSGTPTLKNLPYLPLDLESILITMYILLVSTEIIEYFVVIVHRSPGIWNV